LVRLIVLVISATGSVSGSATATFVRVIAQALYSGCRDIGVDGVVGDGVDRKVFAEHIIPMEGRKAVAGPHPVGDHGGQHRAAATRRDFDLVAVADLQLRGIFGVNLDERSGVELVELGDLAGLGHRVPLVRKAPGVQQERVVVVGHLLGRQVWPGEEQPHARLWSGTPTGARCRPHERTESG